MQTIGSQTSFLEDVPTHVRKRMISSVSRDQIEILRNISALHNGGEPFECDPTYSEGVFYRTFPEPKFKFDLVPQREGVRQSDCRNLPLGDNSIQSILFDPPFVMSGDAHRENPSGKIAQRFSGFRDYEELTNLYRPALKEFYRVLQMGGLLVFKCQDSVCKRKQYLSHVDVVKWAEEVGFYSKDLFILITNNVMTDPRWKNQQHARKLHSYFLVFVKRG